MTEKVYNVLFLCTGNSARSIIAECVIERLGGGRFRGFSAGSEPKGKLHPMAVEVLRRNDFATEKLRSKDWSEFAGADAPTMDFVFTVCDNAAAEECPAWPGQPMTAHWGLPDPAAVDGEDIEKMLAFRETLLGLENRISAFVNLPIESLDRLKLRASLDEIGKTQGAPEAPDRQ